VSKEIITKAAGIIAGKAGEMSGYCTIALIDEEGYPTASTISISKSKGIEWLTFCVSLDDNKARRIGKCNRASVCVSSLEYNITLVGTAEIITDREIKKEMMLPGACEIWPGGADDPDYCVLRFTTRRYNLYVDEQQVAGTL